MNIKKLVLPVGVLAMGVGLGWWLAGVKGAPTAPATVQNAQAREIAPKGFDTITAPEGGFAAELVKVATITEKKVPENVLISGKLAFDAEKLHLVSARVAGRLDHILLFEGAAVKTGDALALLYSPDWISAQQEYLLARNTLRVFQQSTQLGLVDDARATLDSARNKIKVLGGTEADLGALEKTGVVQSHLALRAPIDGVVSQRNMDPGAFLNVGDNFMTISNIRQLWFVGDIYEQDYRKVQVGQDMKLRIQAVPDQEFACRLNFIGTNIDKATHTLPIRCTVENKTGVLKPEMFGSALLETGERDAVVLPKSAIITIKQNTYVIVETAPQAYKRQPVTTELLADGTIAVLQGIASGDKVVIEGGTLINQAINAQ